MDKALAQRGDSNKELPGRSSLLSVAVSALILGGGAREEDILPFTVLEEYVPGPRRSGELFPWGIFPSGTRPGIFVGDLAPDLEGPIVLYFVG